MCKELEHKSARNSFIIIFLKMFNVSTMGYTTHIQTILHFCQMWPSIVLSVVAKASVVRENLMILAFKWYQFHLATICGSWYTSS